MLFVVDVGNSHTVSGMYKDGQLLGSWRLQSHQDKTADELAIRYHGLFQTHKLDPMAIKGFIVASVVPTLETSWLHFARSFLTNLKHPPVHVHADMRLDMGVKVDHPEEVGADRLVNAVAAWEQLHTPLIVIDFGTAITFDCVNAQPAYVGGTIHPGIGISLDALASRTAKLPRLDINTTPEQPIGTSTVKAIHSGMLYGFGGLIDRMVEVLGRELVPNGGPVPTIATGGMATLIKPYARHINCIDEELTLKGLALLFARNKDHV
jgi:type III pantothenate kinase